MNNNSNNYNKKKIEEPSTNPWDFSVSSFCNNSHGILSNKILNLWAYQFKKGKRGKNNKKSGAMPQV